MNVPCLFLAGQDARQDVETENRNRDQEHGMPVPASSSYGLIANLKIVTSKLAMGLDRSAFQNWLLRAYKQQRRCLCPQCVPASNTR